MPTRIVTLPTMIRNPSRQGFGSGTVLFPDAGERCFRRQVEALCAALAAKITPMPAPRFQLRDAQAINQDIYGRANAAVLNQQLTGGIESALANFRIP